MRSLWLVCLLFVSATVLVQAETFQLESAQSGQAYGPFEYRDGAEVFIGKDKYTLVRADKKAVELEERLRSLTVPEATFREALVADVLHFLAAESRQLDPQKKGINLVYMPKPEPLPGPDALGGFPMPPRMKTVTLNLRNVSMLEILKMLTRQTGLKYKFDDGIVVVYHPEEKK